MLFQVEHFLQRWGYEGIFLSVLLGNIGFPLPEETIVLFAGYLAWREILTLPAVIIISIVSAIVGDNLGYWIGRRHGLPLLERYGHYLLITPHTFARARAFFARHGAKTVFLARFIAGLRFLAGPLAGATLMPFPRFALYNAAGAIVWVTTIAGVGYLLGAHLDLALRYVRRGEELLLLLAGVILLVLLVRALHRSRDITTGDE